MWGFSQVPSRVRILALCAALIYVFVVLLALLS